MHVLLSGPFLLSQCSSECSLSGPAKNYLVTKKTPCRLTLSNTSKFRCDVHIWFSSDKLGTWIIPPNDSVTLNAFPGTLETKDIIFFENTAITVKFFQALSNMDSPYKELPLESIGEISTFKLLVTVTDELTKSESENYYS